MATIVLMRTSLQRGSLLDWAKNKISKVFARSSQKAPRPGPSAAEQPVLGEISDMDLPSQPLEGKNFKTCTSSGCLDPDTLAMES